MSGGCWICEWMWGSYRTVGYWWTPAIGRGHLSVRLGWWPFQRDHEDRWEPCWPCSVRWVRVTRRPKRAATTPRSL